jgi:hypothetical protein
MAALAQPPDEIEALVGGNAAADDEQNALRRNVSHTDLEQNAENASPTGLCASIAAD